MNNNKDALGLFSLILVAGLAGCDAATPATDATPAAAAPAAADAPPAPVLPPKVDKIALADLQAGLAAMQPRITSTEDAYTPIKPVANNSRLFMHPLDDKDAVTEFDVSGLSSLTLSPYVEELNGCDSMEAGVVAFTYSLDGGALVEVAVDRNYNELVQLDVSAASKLKVAVNKGNETINCDWASLGFTGVTRKRPKDRKPARRTGTRRSPAALS